MLSDTSRYFFRFSSSAHQLTVYVSGLVSGYQLKHPICGLVYGMYDLPTPIFSCLSLSLFLSRSRKDIPNIALFYPLWVTCSFCTVLSVRLRSLWPGEHQLITTLPNSSLNRHWLSKFVKVYFINIQSFYYRSLAVDKRACHFKHCNIFR